MTPEEVWAMALSRLTEQQWVDFVVEPRFVDDARTENRSEERVVAVRKENIFCLSDIERWRGYLDPAPSWINVTLLRDDGETALFAVEARRQSTPPHAVERR